MENLENLEGKRNDNLEATSASENTDEVVEEPIEENQPVDLNSTPVPTEDEVEDANLNVEPEKQVEEQVEMEENPIAVETTETVVNENVQPVPEQMEQQMHEENGVVETPALFSQSQVNDITGKTRIETREKTFRYIYDRYGVNSEEELDELVGNAQRYDSLQEQYEGDKKSWKENDIANAQKLAELSEQVALMQSGIDDARYEDAKFILKGKGLDVSLENIKNELATHPEWQKSVGAPKEEPNPNFVKAGEPAINPQPAEPESRISVLGNDKAPETKVNSEEDYVLGRMFKV